MTTEQHINSLVEESKQDFGASEALAAAGYYAHSLFFAHLVLEKLCKALWVNHRKSKDYPYIHNLIKLLKETNVVLTNEQVQFYSDMNLFQAKGRYPESLEVIEKTITGEVYKKYNDQLKKEMSWLIEQLQ